MLNVGDFQTGSAAVPPTPTMVVLAGPPAKGDLRIVYANPLALCITPNVLCVTRAATFPHCIHFFALTFTVKASSYSLKPCTFLWHVI